MFRHVLHFSMVERGVPGYAKSISVWFIRCDFRGQFLTPRGRAAEIYTYLYRTITLQPLILVADTIVVSKHYYRWYNCYLGLSLVRRLTLIRLISWLIKYNTKCWCLNLKIDNNLLNLWQRGKIFQILCSSCAYRMFKCWYI